MSFAGALAIIQMSATVSYVLTSTSVVGMEVTMMRTIDADALMEEFASRARAARNWKEGATMEGNSEAAIRADATLTFLSEIKLTIEKAPTVEPCYQTTSCLDCGNYDKENYNCPRFCEVIKGAIKSRPQGKWKLRKLIGEGIIMHECSICGNAIDVDWDEFKKGSWKFCDMCGARMIGGEDNGSDRD